MIKRTRKVILSLALVTGTVLAAFNAVAAPRLPNPILYLLRTEPYTQGGKQFIKYRLDVLNKDVYPAEMFTPAPQLPPCGENTKASRTWVDIYDQGGKRLNGFCALAKPSDLGELWFGLPEDVTPPSYIYIELNDRETKTVYKSNLADTTQ